MLMCGEFTVFGDLTMSAKSTKNRREHRSENREQSVQVWKRASPLMFLLIFMGLTFLMGGGSRAEILSLTALRPLAVLALGAGLMTLRWEHIRRFKVLFIFAAVTFALVALHLIPLSPAIWQSLPGRGIVMDVDAFAGLEAVWRPLSLDPEGTWNAFWSLFVPLAVLVLAVQLDEKEHRIVLAGLIVIGLASALLAIPQMMGDPRGGLYLYRVTNVGSAVGLFANRNHQAVLLACLVPMLAAWSIYASKREGRLYLGQPPQKLLAYIAALVLVPLVLVTGSRAGLLTILIGFGLACWCMGLFFGGEPVTETRPAHVGKKSSSQGAKGKRWLVGTLLGAIPVLGIGVAVVALGRGRALSRLGDVGYTDELRGQLAPVIIEHAQFYAPWGSGLGAFERVFKVHEAEQFLGPAYVNHVHNDYLEVVMTGGIPAVALLAIAIIAALIAIVKITFGRFKHRKGVALARAGGSVLLLLAIASSVDYPLRVPSIQLLAILAAVWLSRGVLREPMVQKPVRIET